MKNDRKTEAPPSKSHDLFAEYLDHEGIEEESFWKGWEVATIAIPPLLKARRIDWLANLFGTRRADTALRLVKFDASLFKW